MIETDYLIYGLIHGKISPDYFYDIFDGDLDCLRFFSDLDAIIINGLLNGGRHDVPRLYNEIGKSGQERLGEINAYVVTASIDFGRNQALLWATAVQEEWQRAAGGDALRDARVALDNPDNEPLVVLSQASSDLANISTLARDSDMLNARQAAGQARNLIYSHLGLIAPRHIPTGFTNLDHSYAPLERNKTIIVAGKSGSGKTALVAQWLERGLDDGMVGIWFCELPPDDMMARDALRNTRAGSYYKLRKIGREQPPSLVEVSQEKKLLDEEIDRLGTRCIYYRPSYIGIREIMAACRYVASREGQLDFIVFDHIRLYVQRGKNVSDSFRIPQNYIDINKAMSRHFPDCSRIVLQHLNRDISRTFRGAGVKKILPDKDDISYGAADHVDSAFILIRDDQYRTALLGLNADEKLEEMKLNNPIDHKIFKERAWLWASKVRRGVENESMEMRNLGGYYYFEEVGNGG